MHSAISYVPPCLRLMAVLLTAQCETSPQYSAYNMDRYNNMNYLKIVENFTFNLL